MKFVFDFVCPSCGWVQGEPVISFPGVGKEEYRQFEIGFPCNLCGEQTKLLIAFTMVNPKIEKGIVIHERRKPDS